MTPSLGSGEDAWRGLVGCRGWLGAVPVQGVRAGREAERCLCGVHALGVGRRGDRPRVAAGSLGRGVQLEGRLGGDEDHGETAVGAAGRARVDVLGVDGDTGGGSRGRRGSWATTVPPTETPWWRKSGTSGGEAKPSVLKLWSTSRTRSVLVNDTSAIFGTGIPWAESSTVWARRQVTTEPVPRRMIRSRLRPSSSSISRTRTGSATRPAWLMRAAHPCTHRTSHPPGAVYIHFGLTRWGPRSSMTCRISSSSAS
ncbi:hypothetical protein GA0115258_10392 [Streptomyces sp. LamerLS-31b]|nr:hypothetical protein GA0115258_10392 [Streptomyces sp. LamerLS-31b]